MIAFGTVVYTEALEYFDEFIDSVNSQSDNKFDLIIVNDNINENTLLKHLNNIKVNYKVLNYYGNKTPADLRVELLKFAKKTGYNLLIFGDSDDIFNENRVKEIKEIYLNNKDFTFFYNNLLLFDKSKALKEFPLVTDSINDIIQYNYLGLSNTAINLSGISIEFIDSLYGCTSFVFDWYLFSRIVCNCGKGKYVEKAITYYRIHENNFAGVSNRKQLDREFEVKKTHYELMSKYNRKYAILLQKLLKINFDKIKVNEAVSYWWNNIKL